MNKTLLFMSTHFVDKAIISEYKKMRDTPNVDAILAIDNNAFKYDFKGRIENKIFYGVSAKCFFFDSKLHDEMELPHFTSNGLKGFGQIMWNNGFSCENLDGEHVEVQHLYLNDDRFFLTPDDKLYHSVKSTKKELSRLNDYIDYLKLRFRKFFLTTLVKSLDKFNFPYKFDSDFNYVAMFVVVGDGHNQIYYMAKIVYDSFMYIALHCDGIFSDISIEEFKNIPNLNDFRVVKNKDQLSLFTTTTEIDDVAQDVAIIKNLIESTYPVIKKNSNIDVLKV